MSTPIAYKLLSDTVKRQGFLYRKCVREGDWAIFEQFQKKPEKSVGFEVVRIGRHNGFSRVFQGVEMNFPPAETYPTSSQWGRTGWTYRELDLAKTKMAERIRSRGDLAPEIIEDDELLAEIVEDEADEAGGM